MPCWWKGYDGVGELVFARWRENVGFGAVGEYL